MKTRVFALVSIILLAALLWNSCERNDMNGPISVSTSYDMVCKGGSELKTDDLSPESTCINFRFEGDSVLTLMHKNAAFNCCPESFKVDVELKGDSLIIREDDAKQLCKCNCLYDLDIMVHNIAAGTYHVRIIEAYPNEEEAQLVFDINLKKDLEGEYCVSRAEGWWR
jgi:hypothetical protein